MAGADETSLSEEASALLSDLGWTKARQRELARKFPDTRPGRIVNLSRGRHLSLTAAGYVWGPLPRTDTPSSAWLAVGDWVALTDAGRIAGLLDRATVLSRKVPGDVVREQLIAANIDYAFIIQGLDGDFNLRRIERTIALVRAGGAMPIVILTKEDLAGDLAEQISLARRAAGGATVLSVCVPRNSGIGAVRNLIGPGTTVVFLGSSGAGKSTLINALLGWEIQKTAAVRGDDSRGRHTTTSRRMFRLDTGGFVIDNPGMRELQLWEADSGVADAFPDIAELARSCRFRDCRHSAEPDCAVTQAVVDCVLDAARFESYRKLVHETEAMSQREKLKGKDSKAAKNISRAIRELPKRKRLSDV